MAVYNLSWTAPTTRTDTSPLPTEEIRGYIVQRDFDSVITEYETETTSLILNTLSEPLGTVTVAAIDIYGALSDFVTVPSIVEYTGMTAYVKNATGDFDNAAHWTPNGVPDHSLGDTFTHGTFTTTIPAGKTWNMPSGAMTGTNTNNRARIINNGTLVVNDNVTMNAWNELVFGANSFTDFRNNAGFRYANVSSDKENSVITSGTSESGWATWGNTTYTSGQTTAAFSSATASVGQQGFLDVKYLIIKDMVSVLYGSGTGTNLMNHYRVENCVFDNAGFIQTAQFSRLSNDFIFRKNDIRHSNPAVFATAYFMELRAERNTAGTPTGVKDFSGNTFTFTGTEVSTKYVRFISADYFTNVSYVTDSVSVQIGSTNTGVTYSGCCHRSVTDGGLNSTYGGQLATTQYQDNIYVFDATDYDRSSIGSFHGYETQALGVFKNNFMEEIFLQTGLDGSDWFGLPITSASPLDISGNILVTQNGGVFVNSWKGNTTASINLDHNTYVAKYVNYEGNNSYGMLMRTESGQRYTGGTNNVRSNLVLVFAHTVPTNKDAAVYYFSSTAALADQIDYVDFNTYYNVSTTQAGIYAGVTITGKVLGDVGYGSSDTFVDPMFNNYPSRADKSIILGYASTFGYTTTKALWANKFLKINGFNDSTRKQESALIVASPVQAFLTYARAAVTPSNSLLATSAHDGTSRGAVQFTGADTYPRCFYTY